MLSGYIILKSIESQYYLRLITDGPRNIIGNLQSSENRVESPHVKFEVEMAREASNAGLVHIRSCLNNKYWVGSDGSSVKPRWITATTRKPEEDRSKASCTLFKPIQVNNGTATTFRFMHVHSSSYVCVWDDGSRSASPFNRCVQASSNLSCKSRDIFTIIDWSSLVFLPKYVAFKGSNDKYLCVSEKNGHPYLMFSATDIGDPAVTQEVFVIGDGYILLKPSSHDRFWRSSSDRILADCGDTSSSNSNPFDSTSSRGLLFGNIFSDQIVNISEKLEKVATSLFWRGKILDKSGLFLPLKVDDQTIALKNVSHQTYCQLTAKGKKSYLSAATPSVVKEAQLKVEEPVMCREISNTKYFLDDARVYSHEDVHVAKTSASNFTCETSSVDVKLSYTDTKTTTWKTNASLKLGANVELQMGIPLIISGGMISGGTKVQLSGEFQTGFEWAETMTTTTVVEVLHHVVVPPMTKVTVDLLATRGKCDVPFSFTQKDVLFDGRTVISEVEGGTFTGTNYYNIKCETKSKEL